MAGASPPKDLHPEIAELSYGAMSSGFWQVILMRESREQKFLGIQALRMVAASLVVVTHSTFYAFERLDKGVKVWERGTRGVDIFFVISGFVMIYSSQRLFALSSGWKIFAEHRIVRIVPLYWLLTTLKVLILALTVGFVLHAKLSVVTAICSYLFLPSRNLDGKLWPLMSVGWTLNLEMLFYFFFTLSLFLRKNVYQFVGVALTLLAIGAYFRQPNWPPVSFYLDTIVLEFYLGMLIAKACINGVYLPKKRACFLLGLGFVLLLALPTDWNVPKILLSGLPAGMIIWSAASLETLSKSIPRFALYLGEASYAIYLIHPFVCPLPPTMLHRMHLDLPWLSVCCSVAIGVGAGCILHQLIELPMTNWLKGRMNAPIG
jgi:exopolysaccharide production protein ExoZ